MCRWRGSRGQERPPVWSSQCVIHEMDETEIPVQDKPLESLYFPPHLIFFRCERRRRSNTILEGHVICLRSNVACKVGYRLHGLLCHIPLGPCIWQSFSQRRQRIEKRRWWRWRLCVERPHVHTVNFFVLEYRARGQYLPQMVLTNE